VPTYEERLARTFVEIADTLVDDFDVVDLYALLAERCVELFDVSAAGLLLVDPQGTLRLVASTSEATELVELFQIQNDEGPCLDCFRTGEPKIVPDIADVAGRWTSFAAVAGTAGFQAVNAFPLRLRSQVLGALNLFGDEPRRLGHDQVAAAQALADVATIGLLQHRAVEDAQTLSAQLGLALESRVAIEQAKGIIAERTGVGMDEAFARLRLHARSRQRRLSAVAAEVVARAASTEALDL
jgi:GAF domain-containing protein